MRAACLLLALALIAPVPAAAETLVAARTVRAQALLSPADVKVVQGEVPGALARADEAVGLETRVVLYAGRPIRPQDVGPPALIDRNQIVTLVYRRGGLTIAAEGRAMARAGLGDRVRVMNLASRSTVTGTVRADGSVTVGGPDLSRFD